MPRTKQTSLKSSGEWDSRKSQAPRKKPAGSATTSGPAKSAGSCIADGKSGKRKFKPSTIVRKKVYKMTVGSGAEDQNFYHKAPFQNLVRDITRLCGGTDVRYTRDALSRIQAATEQWQCDLFEQVDANVRFRGRCTAKPKDISHALKNDRHATAEAVIRRLIAKEQWNPTLQRLDNMSSFRTPSKTSEKGVDGRGN